MPGDQTHVAWGYRFLNRGVCFTSGYFLAYAFCNPDVDNVYDVFPLQRSRYAFINAYEVKPEDQYTFECRWKDLARFYQMQPGYLFNKLEKLQNMHVDATYQYYDVMQWSTGEAYRRATMKAM